MPTLVNRLQLLALLLPDRVSALSPRVTDQSASLSNEFLRALGVAQKCRWCQEPAPADGRKPPRGASYHVQYAATLRVHHAVDREISRSIPGSSDSID
jgi:hypothetical protein